MIDLKSETCELLRTLERLGMCWLRETLVKLGMIEGFGQTGYLRVEEDGTFLIEVYFD